MADTKERLEKSFPKERLETSLANTPLHRPIVNYYSFWPRNPHNPKIKIVRSLLTENLLVYGLKYNALEFIAYQVSKLDISGYRKFYAPYFFFIGMVTGMYGMWKGVESVMSPLKTSQYKQTINKLLSATIMSQYLLGVAIYSDLLLHPKDAMDVSDAKMTEIAAAPFAFAFVGYLAWLKFEKQLLDYCKSDGRVTKYKCGSGETVRDIARRMGFRLIQGMHFLWRWVIFTSIFSVPFKLYDKKTPLPLAEADTTFKVGQIGVVSAGLVTAGVEQCFRRKNRQKLEFCADLVTAGCVGAETYYAIEETPPPFWLLILRLLFLSVVVVFGLYFTCTKTRKIYKETISRDNSHDDIYQELSDQQLIDEDLKDQCSPASLAKLTGRATLTNKELHDSGLAVRVSKVKKQFSTGSAPSSFEGAGPQDSMDLGVPYMILPNSDPNSDVGEKIIAEIIKKSGPDSLIAIDTQIRILDAKIRGQKYASSLAEKQTSTSTSSQSTPQFNQARHQNLCNSSSSSQSANNSEFAGVRSSSSSSSI